ncbi:MAG: hypothetical protein HFACDABA_02506 [Anaerolineales bacterium]|nr:hypothetical protein [Anaerolineales bacterium]
MINVICLRGRKQQANDLAFADRHAHAEDFAARQFALGLPIPAEWDGVPVYEAFGLPVVKESTQCK